MTSYLSKSEAKNLQNGDAHLAQIFDFGSEYLDALKSVITHFLHFSCSSFKLNFCFD